MKVIINKEEILSSLSHVQSIVEKRNTIPILSNVLFEALDNNLTLSATDMDISITEKIKCNIIEEGSITVPAHTIYDIVRKLPDGSEIEFISNDGSKFSIRSSKSKFSLPCLSKDDFPLIENKAVEFELELEIGVVSKLIDKTKFAMSNEETRYFLNGIYLHHKVTLALF